MNRSAQSSSKSHHQVGAGAPNLPFGIDHILSSSSAGSPMKQVQQAMASIDHQSLHFNLQQQQQQHLNHQQLSHFQQQQQQQAAAMQLMLSSAGLPGAPNLAPGNPSRPAPDFMSGASLNEQLALLAAASQHQQQQQQLLNPGALAAAAQAQQHLQWQYQQQQLMSAATAAAAAAAAAAASQHRQAADSLAGLGPLGGALSSLNALAAQSQNLSDTPTTTTSAGGVGGVGSTSPTTNHLLSCFMASMLLQQQQQQQAQKQASQQQQHQQQQHHNAREHLHHDALAGGHMAPFLPAASQQQRLPLSSAGPLCHFGNHADLSAPVGGQQRRSPSTSTTSTSSPIKQFLGDKNHSPSAQEQHHVDFNSLNRFGAADAHHSPLSSSATTTTTTARHPNDSGKPASKGCKPLAAPKASQQHAKVAPSSSALVAGARPPTGASSTNSSNNNNHDATDADDECGAGTALSSLSNFVSKSLAPILDEFNSNLGKQQQRASAGQRTLMAAAGHQSRHAKASNNGSISSGSDSSMIDDVEANANHQRKLVASARGANGGNEDNILKAVATALKGAATNPANSIGEPKTINTAIARAPPELVQKQPAWVFCTRYSDRPSSGPRTRRAKSKDKKPRDTKLSADEKRPRTAFTSEQLEKLRLEFQANSYLDEKRRKSLADRLCLNENQIKIWFQNKRAKMKKQSNQPNPLRGLLVAGGLYNHSTATSDCSESYANGQADDVGNRAIRDFEQEGADGDENDEEEDGEDALLLNSDDDENGRADENGRRRSSELKPGRVEQAQRHHNHSIENLTRDELNDKQRQATTGGGGGARSGNNEPLKRARASVEGEDERNNNSDLNGNGSSPCSVVNPLKRAKLDQQAGGSPASNLGKDLAADEPVISVS